MLFGDIFAVFVLHQNAGAQRAALIAASQAVVAGDAATVSRILARELWKSRHRVRDAHVHCRRGCPCAAWPWSNRMLPVGPGQKL
jgi:hypothetical protein